MGAHSTSDDDTKYRTEQPPEEGWDSERAYWEARSPIIRFGRYLALQGWWNVQMEDHVRAQSRREAIEALNRAQAMDKPAARYLFSDVYDKAPWMQAEQQRALAAHLASYGSEYSPQFTDKQLTGL